MAFDYDKFDQTTVLFPTRKVPVPQLSAFFPEGEAPEWEIKPLTGLELGIVEEAGQKSEAMRHLFEALAGNTVDKMKSGFDELFNLGDDPTPAQYLRWVTIFELGSVPRCPKHIAVKIAHAQAGVFRNIVHEISKMSAMGADLGK